MKSAKGSVFEREISKRMSLWWTDGQRDDIFWRSQSSGARATIRKKTGKSTANQDGDLTAMDSIGEPLIKFASIELKRGYPDFTIEGILNKPGMSKPILMNFLAQCQRETFDGKRFYWLIVKQDRKAEIIIFGIEFRRWLAEHNFRIWDGKVSLILSVPGKTIMAMRLSDFLETLGADFRKEVVECINR